MEKMLATDRFELYKSFLVKQIDIVHRESNVGEESDLYQKVYCICCWDCCDGGYASML